MQVDSSYISSNSLGADDSQGLGVGPLSLCPENPPISNTGGAVLAEGEKRLLAFSLDSCYWHVAVAAVELQRFKRELAEGDRPQLAELKTRGVLGYEFGIRAESGLLLLFAPESNLGMGIYVEAGPHWLRRFPIAEWEDRLRGVLESWGFSEVVLRLSRVDPCADVLCSSGLPEVGIGDVVSKGRARQVYYEGGSWRGLSVGKGLVRFRLYDKLAQCGDEWRFWMHEVWKLTEGIASGEEVWRFEWQLRRDALKEWGVDTVSDLISVQGDVMRGLLDWVRFAGAEEGHDNHRPDLPLWAWLRREIGGLQLGVLGVVRGVFLRLPKLDQLKAQAVGLLASITCGLSLVDGMSAPGDVSKALEWVSEGLKGSLWELRLSDRWRAVRVASMA